MQTTDDLAFIRQLMERSRRITVLGGHYLVVWGLLVSLGLAAMWSLIESSLVTQLNASVIWFVVLMIGWIYTFWAKSRDRLIEGAESRDGFLIGAVWAAFGICGLLFAIGSLALGAIPGRSLSGIYATITGMAFFLHGTLSGIRWLKFVGALWWLAAIPLFMLSGSITLVAYAATLMLLQVIPGILLTVERRRLLSVGERDAV
ncbi:MAG: hypothetical protein RL133_295 [Pseudomonadota bacterium]